MNVKTKINCKTESYFLIMFNTLDCNIQHGGPHSDSWRAACWEPLAYTIFM